MSGVGPALFADEPSALPRQHRIAVRAASFGILAVLLALVACAAWGAANTYRADVAVQRATGASEAMEAARKGLAAEQAARRAGGAEPSEVLRAQHQTAAEAVLAALAQAHMFTDGADRRLVEALQARHGAALRQAGLAWRGPDGGLAQDEAGKDGLAEPPGPLADAVADRFRAKALGLQHLLLAIQWRVFVGGPIFFGLGLVLVGLIWRLQRAEQRRGTARLVRDAYEAGRGERRFAGVVQHAPELVLICAPPGHILYANGAAERVWSYEEAQLDRRSVLTLAHPEDRSALGAWWEQLRPGSAPPCSLDVRFRDGAGLWRPVKVAGLNLLNEPTVQGIVLTISDNGQSRLLEQERSGQALLDALTRLPNATLLLDRLQQAIARAGRVDGTVGVLAIGLDGLAGADEAFGPGCADAMTLEAAARIQACLRAQDTAARLDRTTFIVLRDPADGEADADAVAEAIAVQFGRPLLADRAETVRPVRIGITMGNARAPQAEGLIRDAGLAMRQVTAGSAVRYAVFRPAGASALLDSVELESDLREAVQRLVRDGATQEFRVHYQPVVAMSSGAICGFEALIRWQHPGNGLVAPKDFIPMAEASGLIVPLGQWVLEEACRQVMAWQRKMRPASALTLSVNLSSLQFQQANLVADVERALSAVGLSPLCLRLEVTEGTIMRDADAAVRTLWSLKELGVQLAIDDFGSGYASLPYLKQLPLGLLKIDGAFVSGVGRNAEDTAAVRAVISLAKSLGWGVTAEGIETDTQARLLKGWGCDYAQGYHFGRPLEAEDAAAFLDTKRLVSAATRVVETVATA